MSAAKAARLSSNKKRAGRALLISSAARNRIKLAIDQLEEGFHRYDERSTQDANESYEAALQRGKAMGYQEAAHLVKSALHDIDVKSL
jgi:flagellar biosynthesis/type III secretory pathway protein FliH